ncbi:hypothetical protein [Hymenobacter sp. GOD-10R]|uniref:hypothetical protein n=1 Tax=Hymenobacter sp. GOD-10R TaxID=3093922 RepID=UPI002D796DC3|nr:hypothetical protein [Hymenobacter sp. GOD-10R]WRQ29105.1 hypothetical protein SD425_02360 [Hymenobacter sp. GOD-10R]
MQRRAHLFLLATLGWLGLFVEPARAQNELLPLTSLDGVYTPSKGKGEMKFSFAWPEPSAEFAGFQFSFRVQTFENAYAIDPARTRLERSGDRLRYLCQGFTWAGGQEKAAGELTAELQRNPDGSVEWRVSAQMNQPIKSISTVVRGIPRGELSLAGSNFMDPHDDENTFEYPQLFGQLSTPLIVIKKPQGGFFELSARQTEVRPARFYLQPGPDSYRAELIYEQAGWDKRKRVQSCLWRIGAAPTYEAIAKPFFAHVAQAYHIPAYTTRPDVPAWLRDTKLVVALHGAHWTGFIFNDYAKQLTILRWIATQIDPKNVLVFLPGWDGRYYWNYPLYQTDPRMGGDKGFRQLIDEGHKLGFHFSAMFGTNSANRELPVFKKFADAITQHTDGDNWDLNWVDWDNDRHGDGWMPVMNVGVASWRNYLRDRIDKVIKDYHVDSYFMDIAGLWENNPKADMYVGTQQLVTDLARRHPGVLPIAEMHYDALMSVFPLTQVPRYSMYPAGFYTYVDSYNHLSTPAPGSGSTGVHEYGFSKPRPVSASQRPIPTITFANDTFDKYREQVTQDIQAAKARKVQ